MVPKDVPLALSFWFYDMRIFNKSSQAHNFLQNEAIHSRWLSDYLNSDIDRFYDLAFDYIVAKVNSSSKPSSSILDAGCGYCHHTARLVRRCNGSIVAVDFSDSALSAGKRTIASTGTQNRVSLVKGDLTALQFESERFDAVICWGVLMHIPNLEAALNELVRVLRPGGYMVLCENNMRSLDARIRIAAIRALRAIVHRNKNTTSVLTDRGLEAWYSMASGGLMVRLTNMNYLINFLAKAELKLVERRAGQFSEAYVNLPNRGLKRMIYQVNEWYFRLNLWPSLAHGNILLFRKA
jgi:ubiquinone/menaquinone biosynthesis C-methylase UbiE